MQDGSSPRNDTEQLKDWSNYFEKLLNGPILDSNLEPTPASEDLPIYDGPILESEVDVAIDQLHDNKAPGLDNVISPEVLKRGGNSLRKEIFNGSQV